MSTAAAVRAPEALSVVWNAAWSQLVTRVGTHCARSDAREHAAAYLRGLLSTVERKNGWQLAEAVGDSTPYALQHLLGRARVVPAQSQVSVRLGFEKREKRRFIVPPLDAQGSSRRQGDGDGRPFRQLQASTQRRSVSV